MKNAPQKHIIIAKVDNKPGVVSRISGLFTRRGYNIESLVTCMTLSNDVYHLTISVISTEDELYLLTNQLGRIMEVITVFPADGEDCVKSELMLIKVTASPDERSNVITLADALKLKISAVSDSSIIIEAVGESSKLDGVIKAFEPFGIVDAVRSGTIALDI